MGKLTKDDIKKAFLNKTGKRNKLLYTYYKEEYFHQDLTASIIAEKISEDLGIPITRMMIYMINTRYINKQKAALTSMPVIPPPAVDTFPTQQVIKENKTEESKKVQKEKVEYDVYATAGVPKEDRYKKALEGL